MREHENASSSKLEKAFKELCLLEACEIVDDVRWDRVSEHFRKPLGIMDVEPEKALQMDQSQVSPIFDARPIEWQTVPLRWNLVRSVLAKIAKLRVFAFHIGAVD